MIKEEEIALYVYGGQVGMCHSFLPCSISFHLVFKDSKLAPFFFLYFHGGPLVQQSIAGGRHANQCCFYSRSQKVKKKKYIYIYIYKTNVVLFCQNLNKSFTVSLDMGGGQDSNHVSHYWSGQVTHCLPHIFYPLI